MASTTTKLKLIKPAFGEYYNRWWEPLNLNFDTIDSEVGAIKDEVIAARGSMTDLATRLDVGINANGELKPTAEVETARSSKIYGSSDGSTDFDLDARIESADLEIFEARMQLSTLKSAMAWSEDENVPNSVISAPNSYLTFTGAVVTCNGLVTNVVANINGYRQVVRTNKTTTISGGAGTYYLYLERQPTGEVIYTIPVATGQVSTYTPTGKLQKFISSSGNFVTAGVKPGDRLIITGVVPNAGSYIVLATNVEDGANLNPNELRIIGEFEQAATGLDATVSDLVTPTFSFTNVAHGKAYARASGRVYIGRVVFDGANVTSLTEYALKGKFESFTSVSAAPTFDVTISHNLGFFPRKVSIYGSQANDFSQPLELLSVAEVSTGTASITTGSVIHTDPTLNFNPGATSLSPNTPQVLSYTAPTASLSPAGGVTYTPPALTYVAPVLRRSVIAKMSDTQIQIKNPSSGLFYRDYNGSDQASGYVYVVLER